MAGSLHSVRGKVDREVIRPPHISGGLPEPRGVSRRLEILSRVSPDAESTDERHRTAKRHQNPSSVIPENRGKR